MRVLFENRDSCIRFHCFTTCRHHCCSFFVMSRSCHHLHSSCHVCRSHFNGFDLRLDIAGLFSSHQVTLSFSSLQFHLHETWIACTAPFVQIIFSFFLFPLGSVDFSISSNLVCKNKSGRLFRYHADHFSFSFCFIQPLIFFPSFLTTASATTSCRATPLGSTSLSARAAVLSELMTV